MKRKSLKRIRAWDILVAVIAALLACVFLLPFLSVLAKSLSDEASVLTGAVGFIPVNPNLSAYRYVLSTNRFFKAFGNSLLVTFVGTAAALLLNCLAAFPIAHKDFRHRNVFRYFFMFTMIFSAGVVPGYLIVRSLGMLDTYWALIVPAMLSPYNLMIIVSFMQGIHPALDESARIDGASDFTIFFQIYLPLCKPVLASMALFFAVGYWNDYFRPLMFIQKESMFTLALYLRKTLVNASEISKTLDVAVFGNVAAESVQNATIIVSTVPILLVYPFVQRYFVTGMSLGAIKG